MVVHKIVIGVSLVHFGKVLCIGYSDGSVEYRDRFTMAELYREPNLDRINSILDIGFSQNGDPSCKYRPADLLLRYLINDLGLQMALSPTNFSMVQLCEDSKVKWHSINYTIADIESMTDSMYTSLELAPDNLHAYRSDFRSGCQLHNINSSGRHY